MFWVFSGIFPGLSWQTPIEFPGLSGAVPERGSEDFRGFWGSPGVPGGCVSGFLGVPGATISRDSGVGERRGRGQTPLYFRGCSGGGWARHHSSPQEGVPMQGVCFRDVRSRGVRSGPRAYRGVPTLVSIVVSAVVSVVPGPDSSWELRRRVDGGVRPWCPDVVSDPWCPPWCPQWCPSWCLLWCPRPWVQFLVGMAEW